MTADHPCHCRELPGACCRARTERVPWDSVRPARENASLYARWDIRNADDKALYESIRDRGILEPIVVDGDGVILSGHRRHAAALSAEIGHVPIRRESWKLADLQQGERLRVLAAYNSQRRKTAEEQAREELATVEPSDAWRAIRERIEQRERQAYSTPANAMHIHGTGHRAAITAAKRPMLDAVQGVIEARRAYWPLSVRQVHYALLNDPPRIHASKRTKYRNDKKSYRALVDLCARARLAGLIPWQAIGDETRPVELWEKFSDAGEYVASEARYMLGCYRRDLMQSQTRHIEIVVEKNTAAELVRRVANEYTLPVTSGRGYCSLEPRRQIAERCQASGKSGLVLILVSDADPDGDEISESLARSMRDDFEIFNVHAVRAALTPDQATMHGLPPNTDAKTSSVNYQKFVERHGGRSVYELEAVPPDVLQALVRDAIESVIDCDAYDAEIETWKQEAAALEKVRQTAVSAVLNSENRSCPNSEESNPGW